MFLTWKGREWFWLGQQWTECQWSPIFSRMLNWRTILVLGISQQIFIFIYRFNTETEDDGVYDQMGEDEMRQQLKLLRKINNFTRDIAENSNQAIIVVNAFTKKVSRLILLLYYFTLSKQRFSGSMVELKLFSENWWMISLIRMYY